MPNSIMPNQIIPSPICVSWTDCTDYAPVCGRMKFSFFNEGADQTEFEDYASIRASIFFRVDLHSGTEFG